MYKFYYKPNLYCEEDVFRCDNDIFKPLKNARFENGFLSVQSIYLK